MASSLTRRVLVSRVATSSIPSTSSRRISTCTRSFGVLHHDSLLQEHSPRRSFTGIRHISSTSPNQTEGEFKAETRQLLDIVTHSLYTDKQVFLRELVSNASDALEKLRHVQSTSVSTIQPDVPLEIRIETDEMNGTLTVSDTGIGMTRDELVDNLGTIAKSGSKQFLKDATEDNSNIIGKFGVGFYSSFMVGDKVEVRSKSATSSESDQAQVWSSSGQDSFQIEPLEKEVRQDRGSSIVIHLKEDELQYSDEATIEKILKKYSNFVGFPIYLNGNRVNTLEALWTQDASSIKQETYTAFYKYLAHAMDEPLDQVHFRADAPLDVAALLFIPSFHSERYGMGRMEPGVSLYCRKVLIESKSPDILPDWLRFVKGVVDSEDLPLSISREKAQDSSLIAKLRKVLTRKLISHWTKLASKDQELYKDFYREYHFFLKEGICQDFEFQASLAKLLYFETSKGMTQELISLDEYISQCPPEQEEIYYLCAPSRELALSSPYLEGFQDQSVIFVYTAIDEFCMSNLGTYEGRKLVSVEKGDLNLSEKDKEDDKDTASSLSPDFLAWFQDTVGKDKVSSVTFTSRLSSSPAVVVDSESGAVRRMMRHVDPTQDGSSDIPLPKQVVQLNADSNIIQNLDKIRTTEPQLAKVCALQVFDNCLVAAGLLDDSRSMLPRLNDLLLAVLRGASEQQPQDTKSNNENDATGVEANEERSSPEKPKVEVDNQGGNGDEDNQEATIENTQADGTSEEVKVEVDHDAGIGKKNN